MKKSNLKKPSDIKDVFGAFLLENAEFSKGKYDMPVVKTNIVELPTSVISYQKIGKKQIEMGLLRNTRQMEMKMPNCFLGGIKNESYSYSV